MKAETQGFWQIWLWPVVLGCLSLLGLVAGILGDGWLDLMSWSSLGLMISICAYAFKR